MNNHITFSKLKFKNQIQYCIRKLYDDIDIDLRNGDGIGEWEYQDIGCGDGIGNWYCNGECYGSIDYNDYDLNLPRSLKTLYAFLTEED